MFTPMRLSLRSPEKGKMLVQREDEVNSETGK